MSIDNLLDRVWTKDYTCNEFLCESWKQVTGKDMTKRLDRFLKGKGRFKRLNEPISPCIVFFTNGPRSSTHVGLFYCDKVLHLSAAGAQYIPLELLSMYFKETRFYT